MPANQSQVELTKILKIMSAFPFFKTGVLTLLLACFYASGTAQFSAGKPFKTGEVPELYKFQTLTDSEAAWDTRVLWQWEQGLVRLEDGTAFREGVSAEAKATFIARYKAAFRRYRDNRSRHYLTPYTNGHLNWKPFMGVDTLTAPCDCTLAGDTLNLEIGLWQFGGFTIAIQLYKNDFKSVYREYTYKQKIYSTRPENMVLTDSVFVENEMSLLILDRKPKYEIGESLLGYFAFKTAAYYKLNDLEDSVGGSLDKLYLRGSLHFKCIVGALPASEGGM